MTPSTGYWTLSCATTFGAQIPTVNFLRTPSFFLENNRCRSAIYLLIFTPHWRRRFSLLLIALLAVFPGSLKTGKSLSPRQRSTCCKSALVKSFAIFVLFLLMMQHGRTRILNSLCGSPRGSLYFFNRARRRVHKLLILRRPWNRHWWNDQWPWTDRKSRSVCNPSGSAFESGFPSTYA